MSEAAKEQWGIVSLMGHKTYAGKISEEEKFGAKMGRVDVPGFEVCVDCGGYGHGADRANGPDPDGAGHCEACEGKGRVAIFTTVWFGGQSVYSLSYTDEETAREAAKGTEVQPAGVYNLRNQVIQEIREGDKEREMRKVASEQRQAKLALGAPVYDDEPEDGDIGF